MRGKMQGKRETAMKKNLFLPLLCVLLGAAAPFLALLCPLPAAAPATPESAAPTPTAEPVEKNVPQTVTVSDAGQRVTVPVEEFLIGAAACEVPPDWPEDAIRAQMVASHSYALYLGDEPMQVNSAQCLGWTDADVLRSRWGDAFEEYYALFARLADEVAGAVLTYDGAPAAACYHAASNGHTEASQNVWLEAIPYLQGVDSAWDKTAEDFAVTVEYTPEQISAALTGLGVTTDGAPESWFGAAVPDEYGYVKTLPVCGGTVTGAGLRGALGLRSSCFSLVYEDDIFRITTYGYGHGVGLSQQGARAMAAGGAGWQEILLYYYPGCEITGG